MRVVVIFFTLCLLSACEPVDFTKRTELSLVDRARAVETLRQNAAAFSAGDIEAVEATMHPEAEEAANAQALFDRYAPLMEISGVKCVAQSPGAVVFTYFQSIKATRGHLPVTGAQVRTTLRRTADGWGIISTDVIKLVR